MVTETTNTVFVQLSDYAELTNRFTNFVVTGYVPTNGYSTNILGTNVLGGEFWFRFNDQGRAPDTAPDDGLFGGRLITPLVTEWSTNLVLRLVVSAEDMVPTGQFPDDTNAAIVSVVYRMPYIVVARPGNDRFTNAFKVTDPGGGVVTGTNNYASREPREPQHASVATGDASVWWTWSAGFSTNALVDVAGSSFRPIVAVYTGNTLETLRLVGASTNDTINRLAANVAFEATRGATYRIAVSGYDSNGVGNVRLRVALGTTPDSRPPAVVITSPNREYLTASDQLVVSGTARDATANDSGISNIVLQVNSGPLTNASGIASWSGRVTLPPGTNIVRAFAIDYAGNVSPPDAIVVRYVNPTNDHFAAAARLSGVGGVATAMNRFASREEGEPLHAGNEGGHSVWYSFLSAVSGTLSLSTAGSSFDTLLGVYVGNSLTNLSTVANSDDVFPGSKYSEVIISVLSNQVYYVAVDGYGGEAGDLQLQYAFIAPQPGQFYTVDVQAGPGGRVSPPSGIYPGGSPVTFTAAPDGDYQFAGWSGGVTSQVNPLVLTVNQNLQLRASFRVATTNFVDDFETGNLRRLPWSTDPTGAWWVQTNVVSTGKFSARSAAIDHRQSSSLLLVAPMLKGTASFDLRVSSEPGWDHLEFYLNGVLQDRWSGEVDWTSHPFDVPAGTNRLEWRYVKDTSFADGLDAAFIDNLYYPVPPPDPDAGKSTVSVRWLTSNVSAQVIVEGQPRRTYVLEASTDLNVWLPLVTTNTETGVILYLDRSAVRFPSRFYRAVAQ
jgi:hypothetical protein